jgi:hypothetical protein
MSTANNTQGPPPLELDAQGDVLTGSLADVIEWFINYDPRVAVIRHPHVERVFQWKQEETINAGEEVYQFRNAEDRLAIGIVQALTANTTERDLHDWLSQLLNVLDDAAKTNEEIAEAYKLDASAEASAVEEAQKLPTARERRVYLTCCWLEALCTAEIRVLGWVYQELYGKPYAP